MLTSQRDSTVTDVDSKSNSQSDVVVDHKLNKKRGRCFSRLFQVSSSSSSGRSRHAKKMSASSSSSLPDLNASPSATSAPHSRSTSTSEPSSKRVLRDVVSVDAAEMQQTDVIFVTSSPAESWKEELDKLATSIRLSGGGGGGGGNREDQWKDARNLASSIIRSWVIRPGHGSQSTVIAGPESFNEWNKRDFLSCPKCGGVLHQVATLACGHSFCRKCTNSLDHCYKCSRADNPSLNADQLRTNVTVSTLVEKWWADELKAVELRNAGNQAFCNQLYDQALDKYHLAAQSAPGDFTLLSNRSHCYSKMGKFEEALKDADQVIRLRPNWPKGYYRRAEALKGLGRHEDALLSLLHCAAMERSLMCDVRDDIAKALYGITSSVAKQKCHRIGDRTIAGAAGLASDTEDSSSSSSSEAAAALAATGRIVPSETEEEEDDDVLRQSPQRMMALSLHHQEIHPKLHQMVDRILSELERLQKWTPNISLRGADPAKVDISDFECTLCCRLMWQPVTTPCGHSFCRTCLDRCMDHKAACPLCQTSLENYLAERKQCLTEFLDYAMATYLPQEYADRSCIHDEEMKELASSHNIPIFICTMAYPTVKCPLHVFEPRYRLMIRRCMESGSRQFGMCSYVQDQPQGFAEFGTMLEVNDVEFFPDGRSVVDTVGGRRFRVLRRGVLDGYCTATVEFLVDQPVDPSRVEIVKTLHDRVRQEAQHWINSAPANLRQRILGHFGTMPDAEPDWMTLPNGPAWLWWLMAILPLNPKAQVATLSMTHIEKRLEAIQRGVAYVRQRTL